MHGNSLGTLRPVQDDDIELMLEWRNAPEVRKHMYTQHVIARDEHFAWWEATKRRKDRQYFMYEFSRERCGIVGFSSIDKTHNNASWAFYAAPNAPRGTGSRMEFLALYYAFNVFQLHKLHCEVLSTNGAVIRLHQKFGFKIEGVFREHFELNGTYVDIVRLGILQNEWNEAEPRLTAVLTKKNGMN
jgi:UDP-4-amino-4,6-dideoxy-N-acetyl-beta-L-altrosamine N-acetyltransferase